MVVAAASMLALALALLARATRCGAAGDPLQLARLFAAEARVVEAMGRAFLPDGAEGGGEGGNPLADMVER